jgi:hypothetical protein
MPRRRSGRKPSLHDEHPTLGSIPRLRGKCALLFVLALASGLLGHGWWETTAFALSCVAVVIALAGVGGAPLLCHVFFLKPNGRRPIRKEHEDAYGRAWFLHAEGGERLSHPRVHADGSRQRRRLSARRIGNLIFKATARGGQLPEVDDVRRRLGLGAALDRSMLTPDHIEEWYAGKKRRKASTLRGNRDGTLDNDDRPKPLPTCPASCPRRRDRNCVGAPAKCEERG